MVRRFWRESQCQWSEPNTRRWTRFCKAKRRTVGLQRIGNLNNTGLLLQQGFAFAQKHTPACVCGVNNKNILRPLIIITCTNSSKHTVLLLHIAFVGTFSRQPRVRVLYYYYYYHVRRLNNSYWSMPRSVWDVDRVVVHVPMCLHFTSRTRIIHVYNYYQIGRYRTGTDVAAAIRCGPCYAKPLHKSRNRNDTVCGSKTHAC